MADDTLSSVERPQSARAVRSSKLLTLLVVVPRCRLPMHRLPRRVRASRLRLSVANDDRLAACLPHELLLAILSFFREPLDTLDDAWKPQWYESQRTALASAMRVCRTWHAAAAEVFYAVVCPSTAHSCIALSRSLASNPALATAVRVVKLPASTLILSFPLDKLRFHLRIWLTLLRSQLATAVDTIVRLCVHAQEFHMHSGPDEVTDTHRLREVSNKVQCLSMNSSRWTWTRSRDRFLDDCWNARRDLRFYSTFSTNSLRLQNLEVLRLSDSATLPDLKAGSSLRSAFPRLRALFLCDLYIPQHDFAHLMGALAPSLELLSLAHVWVTVDSENRFRMVDGSVILPLLPPTLDDLRLYLSRWPPVVPDEFGSLVRLTALTRLTMYLERAYELECVPPALKQLTLYTVHSNSIAHMRSILTAAGVVKRSARRWKACAPGLTLVRQRVPNLRVKNMRSWHIQSVLLGYFLEQLHIRLQTEVWLNPTDVMYHTIKCAGGPLPTDVQERISAAIAQATTDFAVYNLE